MKTQYLMIAVFCPSSTPRTLFNFFKDRTQCLANITNKLTSHLCLDNKSVVFWGAFSQLESDFIDDLPLKLIIP